MFGAQEETNIGTRYKRRWYADSFDNAREERLDYLTHKDEPTDGYRASLARGPTMGSSDSRNNLFDDSPREDRKWTQIARRFLKHVKHQ